jgi:hypothetical protein
VRGDYPASPEGTESRRAVHRMDPKLIRFHSARLMLGRIILVTRCSLIVTEAKSHARFHLQPSRKENPAESLRTATKPITLSYEAIRQRRIRDVTTCVRPL